MRLQWLYSSSVQRPSLGLNPSHFYKAFILGFSSAWTYRMDLVLQALKQVDPGATLTIQINIYVR